MINSMARSLVTAKKWYRNMMAGNFPLSAYELIGTALVSSAVTSVSFDVSSLANVYKHLQLRMVGKTASSGDMVFRLNNDSGNNYSRHYLYGNGSSVASGNASSQNYGYISYVSATTNIYGLAIADFPDAFKSNKNKTSRVLCADGTSNILLTSTGWYSTAPVNSITIYGNGDIAAGSRFSLYGIRG